MSRDSLLDVLEVIVSNQLPAILPTHVAFIVGSTPSIGARSPHLWNATFRNLQIDGEMFPLDVSSGEVDRTANALEHDQRVIGVAIAAPYKSEFAKLFVGRLSPAAQKSGSINLLSRKSDGSFIGHNTDGLAAVESLLELEPKLGEKNILILGCGATGRAVIATLLDFVNTERISVVYRNQEHKKWLEDLGVRGSPISSVSSILSDKSILINCTSIGWGSQVDLSPLTISEIGILPRESLVFDVVYQPDPSKLLVDAQSLGLRTLSGGRMNLLQAVVAFCMANPTAKREVVTESMRTASMKQTS